MLTHDKAQITGFKTKKANLVDLLVNWFVNGKCLKKIVASIRSLAYMIGKERKAMKNGGAMRTLEGNLQKRQGEREEE